MTDQTEPEREQGVRPRHKDEVIQDAIRRLHIYQMGDLRIIGLVRDRDGDVELFEANEVLNAVRLDTDVLGRNPNGTFVKAPSMASIDYCQLPIPRWGLKYPQGGYRVRDLDEDSARATALMYLDLCAVLKVMMENPDDVRPATSEPRRVRPAGPGAMAELDRIAKGNPPKPPGQGGIIL
jgi:hypothetical protein